MTLEKKYNWKKRNGCCGVKQDLAQREIVEETKEKNCWLNLKQKS